MTSPDQFEPTPEDAARTALIAEAAQRDAEFLAAKKAYFADPNAEGAHEAYRAVKLAYGEWRRYWKAIDVVVHPDGGRKA